MSAHPLRARTLGLIVMEVIFACVGELLLGIGMKQIGPIRDWAPSALSHLFVRIFTNGTIWAGISCLALFFACYLLVLSWADLTYVKPIGSVGYGVIAVLGYAVLHEQVTPLRWAGVCIICLGVALTSQTEVRTTSGAVMKVVP